MIAESLGGDVLLKRRALIDESLLTGFTSYQIGELGNSQRTASSYRYSLKCIQRWTGKALADISANDLRAFKRQAPFKPATKQQIVVALHQFHKWGALEGHWPINGIMAVPTPKVPRHQRAPLSLDAARVLLTAAVRPLEKRVVLLGLYAGTRIHEAARMDESHLRGDVLVFIGKGNKKRKVPVHPELAAELDEIFSFAPSSEQVLHSAFSRLRSRVSILDEDGDVVTSHTLRRTCATVMYDNGVGWEVVSKILGHGEDVTARYTKISVEQMREAIGRIDYYRGLPVQGVLF